MRVRVYDVVPTTGGLYAAHQRLGHFPRRSGLQDTFAQRVPALRPQENSTGESHKAHGRLLPIFLLLSNHYLQQNGITDYVSLMPPPKPSPM